MLAAKLDKKDSMNLSFYGLVHEELEQLRELARRSRLAQGKKRRKYNRTFFNRGDEMVDTGHIVLEEDAPEGTERIKIPVALQ